MADHLSRIKTGDLPIGVNYELHDAILFKVDFAPDYYDGIVEYLMSGRPPPKMPRLEARKLIRKPIPYQIIEGQLYIKVKDKVFRRCFLPQEIDDILVKTHDGMVGGQFASEVTARKVLQAGL